MTKKYLLILSLAALSIASITAMETDATSKALVPAAQSQTEELESFPWLQLPTEVRQAIIYHDFANTRDIIPLLKRIRELTLVSKTFSEEFADVCSYARLRKACEACFSTTRGQVLFTPDVQTLFLTITQKIIYKNGIIRVPEQKWVWLLNNTNNIDQAFNADQPTDREELSTFVNNLSAQLERLQEQYEGLLLPALLAPSPLIANFIAKSYMSPEMLLKTMITIADSNEFRMGTFTAEHIALFQAMLQYLSQEHQQKIITKYASKDLHLQRVKMNDAAFAVIFSKTITACLERNSNLGQFIVDLFNNNEDFPEMYTRLWHAAVTGDADTLNELLARSTFDNDTITGMALCCASIEGHVNITEILLHYNHSDFILFLPLRESLIRGHTALSIVLTKVMQRNNTVAPMLIIPLGYNITHYDSPMELIRTLCTKLDFPQWMDTFIRECWEGNPEKCTSLLAEHLPTCSLQIAITSMNMLIHKGHLETIKSSVSIFIQKLGKEEVVNYAEIAREAGQQQIADYLSSLAEPWCALL